MNKHGQIARPQNEPQPNRRVHSMRTRMLMTGLNRASQPNCMPRLPVSRFAAHRREDVLGAIDRTALTFGDAALTDGERIVWNTGLVLAIFTDGLPEVFRRGARAQSWSAARRGFIAMGLPDAADDVAMLVKELAYRTEQPRRSRDDEDASLLRLAGLKLRFRENLAGRDPLLMLDALIERIYPWPD